MDKTYASKSFTLIELLVVISIIGLLSSIVLVVLIGPREKARITNILSFEAQVNHYLGAEARGIWNFDDCGGEGSAPATLRDSSGYANTGTNNGAVCREDTPHKVAGQGQGKYALSFEGNDYVDTGANRPSLNVGNAITIEAWVKTTVSPVIQQVVYKRNVESGYGLNIDENNQARIETGNSTFNGVSGTTVLSTNTWYHLVGTYDTNTGRRIYVNGVRENSDSVTGQLAGGADNVTIGERNGDNYFNGLIDEVRVYSQALTQAEIQKQYAEGLDGHNNLAKK